MNAGRIRTAGRSAVAMALAAAAMLVAAAPASAALSYVESADSSTTAGNQGSSLANCPASSFTIGGGGLATGGYGAVAMVGSLPETDKSGWSEFTDVHTGTQVHRAFAVCDTADPTLRLKSKNSTEAGQKTVRAACPSRKHVYGGGFFSGGDVGKTTTRASRPFDSGDTGKVRDDGWEATAFFSTASLNNPVTAWALCGPKKMTVIAHTADVGALSQGLVQKRCGSGERVTGGGAFIAAGQGKGWISSTYPADLDGDGVTDDAWAAYLDNTTATSRDMTVYAICR